MVHGVMKKIVMMIMMFKPRPFNPAQECLQGRQQLEVADERFKGRLHDPRTSRTTWTRTEDHLVVGVIEASTLKEGTI